MRTNAQLEAKSDPNVVELDGWSPLHCAATEGHSEVVRVLLEAKADSCISNRGISPLFLAAQEGRYHTLRALVSTPAR